MNARRAAIAQYEATVVLIVISLSLASIIYGGLKRQSNLESETIFVNQATLVGGNPNLERIAANSSSATVLSSVGIDAASSTGGVLAFSESGFSSSTSLCASGATTFFSVFASQAGLVELTTDGLTWVSGSWGPSIWVTSGWHEVMIVGGTSCSISLPGGELVSGQWGPSLPLVSSLPIDGDLSGTSFTLYVPTDGNPHRLLLTSTGGFDTVAL